MTEEYLNSAFVFYLREKNRSKFISTEILIFLLVTSSLLWIFVSYNRFAWLYTSISIQGCLLVIALKLFITEVDRSKDAKKMLILIKSQIYVASAIAKLEKIPVPNEYIRSRKQKEDISSLQEEMDAIRLRIEKIKEEWQEDLGKRPPPPFRSSEQHPKKK